MKFIQVSVTLAAFIVAVYIATFINPVIGGILAAVPIRLGASLYAIALLGDKAALQQAVRGSVIGWVGVGVFVASLYYFLPRFTTNISFLIASLLCVLVASVGYFIYIY